MDVISAALQSTGVILGFGKSFFKDESRLFGMDGRKLARVCLISSVAFLAADQTREAINTNNPAKMDSAAMLWIITGRSILLASMNNKTAADKRDRLYVANGAFGIGTALSVGSQLAGFGSIDMFATALTTTQLWLGCQMDRQDRQEDASRILFGAGTCGLAFGIYSISPGIVVKSIFTDVGGSAANIYNNYIRTRTEPTSGKKIVAYIKQSAQEALDWERQTYAGRVVTKVIFHNNPEPK